MPLSIFERHMIDFSRVLDGTAGENSIDFRRQIENDSFETRGRHWME